MTLIWKCSSDGLEPQFRADIVGLLEPSAYEWHIMYGYRTLDEQQHLYNVHLAGGPLAAPPGHSAHNYGLAVDVQLIVNGHADWDTDHPGWRWLFAAVAAAPRLHSGVHFGDADHIERYLWRDHKDWQQHQTSEVVT